MAVDSVAEFVAADLVMVEATAVVDLEVVETGADTVDVREDAVREEEMVVVEKEEATEAVDLEVGLKEAQKVEEKVVGMEMVMGAEVRVGVTVEADLVVAMEVVTGVEVRVGVTVVVDLVEEMEVVVRAVELEVVD